MRTRFDSLSQFPSIYQPSNPDNDSKTFIILIPVFTDDHHPIEATFAYLQSALAVRHSWVQNTDAYEHDAEIKLYIEEDPNLMAIIGDLPKDIYTTFRPSDFAKPKYWARLSKKNCIFIDPQFEDYQYTVMVDADCWVCKPGTQELAFFKTLGEYPPLTSFGLAYYNNDLPPTKSEELSEEDFNHFYALQIGNTRPAKNTQLEPDQSPADNFKNLCKELGIEDYYQSTSTQSLYNVYKSWITITPAKIYRNDKDFMEFAKQAVARSDDETFLSFWQWKSKERYFSLMPNLDINNIMGAAYDKFALTRMQAYDKNGAPYIYHCTDKFRDFDDFRNLLYKHIGLPGS